MDRYYWYNENTDQGSLQGAILFLPGRTNHGYSLLRTYTETFDFSGVGLFSVTPPIKDGFYPSPNSPTDQEEAVRGLNGAAKKVDRMIDRIATNYNLTRDRIIVAGFSMGAVTAVHFGTRTNRPVAAVICHSGAVLEPWNVPKAKHQMPIILNHGMDDCCFDWEERYIPMRQSLGRKGYNVWHAERRTGNHLVYHADVAAVKDIFESTFDKKVEYEPVWRAA